ncbi:putative feruloyl esterase b [Diplodia seriata]|uniref:Carboxylic ester hydrolase n=1 Tax=Diplodia seriata TaxID=420778 RepID=A0A0G2DUA6_9PEZI|nr:putative feruloyl esterase b [Diplodia seriata]
MASKLLLSFAIALASSHIPSASCAPTNVTSQCSPSTFAFPDLFGAELVHISASEVLNYSAVSVEPGLITGRRYTIDFCNVTVTYTHPGWNDTINVEAWLPLKGWNDRLMALGGGGYSTGMGSLYLTQAVSSGFAAIDTDGGHESGQVAAQSLDWALSSPGNVNLYLLEDYASRALIDMTVIGKAVTQDYYSAAPEYSYFTGCSGGGRQGAMLAQRYPEGYDGILAVSPALNIENFIPAGFWATHVMQTLGVYPPPCEIAAYTQAAIDACDMLDGVADGIISAPRSCGFTAHSVVGQDFSCDNTTRQFTAAAATIVEAAWNGPRSASGNSGWFGVGKDSDLTSTYIITSCADDNTNCTSPPSELLSGWIKVLSAKDPNFDAAAMTDDDFFTYLRASEQQYHSMMSAADPDLSAFRAAGGKMITWHGLSDGVIPVNGTAMYYEQAMQLDSAVDDFYRFFEAPGLGHCNGGVGPVPEGALDQLMAWVEDGVVPETLDTVGDGEQTGILCPYPLQQTYNGGDAKNASSFSCTKRAGGGEERLADQITFL